MLIDFFIDLIRMDLFFRFDSSIATTDDAVIINYCFILFWYDQSMLFTSLPSVFLADKSKHNLYPFFLLLSLLINLWGWPYLERENHEWMRDRYLYFNISGLSCYRLGCSQFFVLNILHYKNGFIKPPTDRPLTDFLKNMHHLSR
jgi:hypothetical protein